MKKYLSFIIFFNVVLTVKSQYINITGKIKSSDGIELKYATVIADSEKVNSSTFSVTDDYGNFRLKLKKSNLYIITANHLGFKPKSISISFSKDSLLNIILTEATETLEEVTLKYIPSISVKKDTIIYQTDKFTTGEERKLKDILKKLPGIEVDRFGNVSAQGKKISKVLVENKQFFTGDSKLAVNNIPADAVNQIEILDNYNDVTILKGLEDSDEMVMNIKLKKNKKEFWFGDVTVGSGIGLSERHIIHPSLFYYSPKTNVNLIGDINNTGKKSFTFKDYLDFEGGYNKILLNPKAYFSKLNDNFSQFLSNQSFKNSKHLFGGANINQFINAKTDLIGYVIYSKSDNEEETLNKNEYLSNNTNTIENRKTTNNPINDFIISKIGFNNTQSDGTKLKIESFLKESKNKNIIINSSNINNNTNLINTFSKSDNIDFKQNIEWYKNLSKNHTFSAIGSFNFTTGNSLVNWETNNNIFQNIIPITNDTEYLIFKNKEIKSLNYYTLIKHYWILGDFIHLYTTGGIQNYNEYYKTNEYQKNSNGIINNFSSNNFGNNIEFHFNNTYIGSHLKFQKGKFTFKPGVFYHSYSRRTTQANQNLYLNKSYILPEIEIKINLKRREKININYNKRVRFPSLTKLLSNYSLTNFNSVYIGNPSLQNELYHQLSIYYYKFSLFKKLTYNIRLNYKKTEKGIKNNNIIDNINFVTSPILLNNSDENINFSASLEKQLGNYKLSLGSNATFADYLQQLNNNITKNTSQNHNFNLGLRTIFSKFPNFNINYNKDFNNYKTQISNSKFENDNVNFSIEYDFLNNYIFNINYNYQIFNNKNTNSISKNDILNLSVFYQRENNPWGFEFSANNLIDNKYIRNSTFNDFLITDSKEFILPRIILFKISYKI
jgi:hypothetical protein